MTLSSKIDSVILSRIAPRTKHTKHVLDRLTKYEASDKQKTLDDEEVWTLLLLYGFIVGGEKSLPNLANVLMGTRPETVAEAWLELHPMSPRQGTSGNSERNSQIDLILGDAAIRQGTVGGVQYCKRPHGEDGWVCFVEAKWLSDIAAKTTHDWGRNQFARVVETALTFQGDGQFPSHVHVTLLTPRIFKTPRESSASRLYAYKWREYVNKDGGINRNAILADIDRSRVDPRTSTKGWTYPKLGERIKTLTMSWVTYEQLLESMPTSDFKTELCKFAEYGTHLLQMSEVA
ncbi:hypothetical protein [Thalassoglobus polymorphus]|uniref:Uncharacterized protein n=1 Tax=Thalassoglobus polymorphus TaxID=2527994 RepID=A0A517QQP6_9PLAN|nr:hypothetical protein [Thalassoglobus polymorphus]QDT33954.1 hypothetical protein Mal48_32110 [Thalassoglobus polymorphus]